MKKAKIFILTFALLSFVFIVSVPVFNYKIDRYRVFNALIGNYEYYYARVDKKWAYTHNDRFIPMAYLLNEKHNYDSFVFGNSRINNFNTLELGNNWYRINYNSGQPFEHLHNLKLLLKHKIKVKKVILTLDERHFLKSSKINNADKKFLYPLEPSEWAFFYHKHLFKRISSKDIKFFTQSDYHLKKITKNYLRDYIRDTNYYFTNNKRSINDIKINYQDFNYNDIDATLEIISELVELCKTKSLKLKLVILPAHYKKTFNTDTKKLIYLKKSLSIISEFYDFSLPHNYTIDSSFWRETTHYTRVLNDDIIRFLKSEKQLSESFGVLIDKANIDSVVKRAYSLTEKEWVLLKKHDKGLSIHKSYLNKASISLEDRELFSDSTFRITESLTRPIIDDLENIKVALENYYKDNNSFPKSKGWDGLHTRWGYSGKEWIKGLVPKYLQELPRDPRLNNNKDQQYIYKSNGKDYKIISHGAVNCNGVKKFHPDLIDTKRDCYAYGFWTKGGIW